MQQWRYRSLAIRWDRETVTGDDGEILTDGEGWRVDGKGSFELLDAILNRVAEAGWELVSLIPDEWHEFPHTPARGEVIGYRALFKRPTDD